MILSREHIHAPRVTVRRNELVTAHPGIVADTANDQIFEVLSITLY